MSATPAVLHRCKYTLPWLSSLINGVEHANFFETRATEYSKAATRRNWNDVWSGLDARDEAKKGEAANETDGPPLFGDVNGAQVAAESA